MVAYLTAQGIPARREVLHGAADQGDVWACGGRVVIEVKSRRTRPSDEDLDRMLAEANTEANRVPQADIAVLVVKRPGRAAKRAGDWWAFLTLVDLMWLCGSDPNVLPVDSFRARTELSMTQLAALIHAHPTLMRQGT